MYGYVWHEIFFWGRWVVVGRTGRFQPEWFRNSVRGCLNNKVWTTKKLIQNSVPAFLTLMTSSGIEPEFTPWEGVVLTAWPWGRSRGDKIWTCDLCVPNAALYQTEPRLDFSSFLSFCFVLSNRTPIYYHGFSLSSSKKIKKIKKISKFPKNLEKTLFFAGSSRLFRLKNLEIPENLRKSPPNSRKKFLKSAQIVFKKVGKNQNHHKVIIKSLRGV